MIGIINYSLIEGAVSDFPIIVIIVGFPVIHSWSPFCSTQGTPTKDSSKFKRDLERAIRADPLYELSSAEKELIWKFRYHCIKIPEAMPKLLRSVNWADLEQVRERKRREREREREREKWNRPHNIQTVHWSLYFQCFSPYFSTTQSMPASKPQSKLITLYV